MNTQPLMYAIALVTSLMVASPVAVGQVLACDDRQVVLEHLASEYGETRVGSGITNGGQLAEVLSSGEEGTWTIILTGRDGIACLIAAGQGWREVAPVAAPKGEGA